MRKYAKSRREKEVWEACDELWEEICDEGLTIAELTGERLKQKLVELGYKRGNQNQLYQYRNTWQEARGIEENEDLAKEEKRALLSEKVHKAIVNVYTEINAEADAKVTEIKKETAHKLKFVKDERDSIQQNSVLIKEKLDETQKENVELKATLRKLDSEILALKQELELAITESKHAIESYNTAKESFEVRLRELNRFNQELKDGHAEQLRSLETMREKEKHKLIELHEKERQEHVVNIENLKVAVNKLEKKVDRAELLENKAANENKELKDMNKRLEGDLQHEREEYNKQNASLHKLENELSSLQGELKQMTCLNADYKKDIMKYQQQLVANNKHVVKLEEELKRVKDTNKRKEPKPR